MQSKKWLLGAGVTLSAALLLAACGKSEKNADAPKTFSYVYAMDPSSLDYSVTSKSSTSDVIANVVDGLLENDKYGNLIPSLAEDWSVSKDGLTYTYKLRKGVKWYTSEGEEYAEVKAQDFVTGLKHAADGKSDGLSLLQDSIKGLAAYISGESNDFSTVGVKAVDDYTVEYTLNKPESFWNSKVTTATMLPVNEEFLNSKGKDYGTPTPSSILYNGPYLLKSLTSKSAIEYEKNPNYWDKDNVKIDSIKLTFYDGSDQESLIRSFTQDAYTTARLFPTSSNFESTKKELEAQGVSFPIHLDLPVDQVNKTLLPKIHSLKQSVESTLGAENVVVDVIQISTEDYANATFQAPTTADHDYDLNLDGWSADYQDPSTYLNPFNAEDGFYLKILGLDPSKDMDKITSIGLDQYTQKLKAADAENTDVAKRYENYADAQAWLIDSSLLLPVNSNGGGASVTRVTPFTRAYSLVGIKGTGSNYKYMRLQNEVVTTAQFDEAKAKWEQERKNSVEKSQKDFEKHIK